MLYVWWPPRSGLKRSTGQRSSDFDAGIAVAVSRVRTASSFGTTDRPQRCSARSNGKLTGSGELGKKLGIGCPRIVCPVTWSGSGDTGGTPNGNPSGRLPRPGSAAGSCSCATA